MILPPAPPTPPSPPKILPKEPEGESRRSGEDPFRELGLNSEQFAEVALNAPVDWDAEQLDHLQLLLLGDLVEPEISQELVDDFLHHKPTRDKPRDIRDKEKVPRELMDPEELAEELATGFEPMTYQPITAFDVPSSNVNLDDWLKKKG